jgi:pyridoxal biosynthesis lyase PdxS
MSQNNGHSTSLRLKTGLAEMLKGGVIMDVTTAEQAVIAEKAGAVAVMAWSACRHRFAPKAAWREWPRRRRFAKS